MTIYLPLKYIIYAVLLMRCSNFENTGKNGTPMSRNAGNRKINESQIRTKWQKPAANIRITKTINQGTKMQEIASIANHKSQE